MFQLIASQATLIKTSHPNLVAPLRQLSLRGRTAVAVLGKPSASIRPQPWSLGQLIDMISLTREENYREFLGAQLFIYLPLHFVPYVGTPAFLVLAGHAYAQYLQRRWYQINKLSISEEKADAETRWWEYTAFGSVALALQLVPFCSLLALLTNSAGCAVWGLRTRGIR